MARESDRLSALEQHQTKERIRSDDLEYVSNSRKRYSPGNIWLLKGSERVQNISYFENSIIGYDDQLFEINGDPFFPDFDGILKIEQKRQSHRSYRHSRFFSFGNSSSAFSRRIIRPMAVASSSRSSPRTTFSESASARH